MPTVTNKGVWFGTAVVTAGLVVAGLLGGNELNRVRAPEIPSAEEAIALLIAAHGAAQRPDELCETIAQNPVMCRMLLESAKQANAQPSAELPAVLEITGVDNTRTTQGARVVHITGTRADGTPYQSRFCAVRTTGGEIRSQNAVYWFSDCAAG